jgi:hypothetical protein
MVERLGESMRLITFGSLMEYNYESPRPLIVYTEADLDNTVGRTKIRIQKQIKKQLDKKTHLDTLLCKSQFGMRFD